MGPARSKWEFPATSSVQTWHQRIGVQLWQRDTEYQMNSGFIGKVKSQMNESTNCSGGAGLNGQSDDAVQHVVCGTKTSLMFLQMKSERGGNADVCKDSSNQPDDGNHFESYKLSEKRHDLNRDGGSDGSQHTNCGTNNDERDCPDVVGDDLDPPCIAQLNTRRNYTSHGRDRGKDPIGSCEVLHIIEVDDKRIIDVDQIEYRIECVSQKEKKDDAFKPSPILFTSVKV